MSEQNNRIPIDERKSERTQKKLIILILMLSVIVLYVCCAALFMRVCDLDEALQSMMLRLEKTNGLLEEQQRSLQELQGEIDARRKTDLSEGEALQSNAGVAQVGYAAEGESDNIKNVDVMEPEAAHKVYLTFDDGPSIYTEEILDILDRYDVKATFFVVGKEDDASRERLCKIVEAGHSLGMHSYSHKYSEVYESLDSFAEDFKKLQDYLYDVTGVTSTLYRFPGGSSNTVSDMDMEELAEYLEEQGVTFYDWNISSGDGGSMVLPVEDLVDNCTRNIKNWNTSVILMHDSAKKSTTVEALPEIIETILDMDDTVILPITESTHPVQHIHR